MNCEGEGTQEVGAEGSGLGALLGAGGLYQKMWSHLKFKLEKEGNDILWETVILYTSMYLCRGTI